MTDDITYASEVDASAMVRSFEMAPIEPSKTNLNPKVSNDIAELTAVDQIAKFPARRIFVVP